jgi:hypothetical protein
LFVQMRRVTRFPGVFEPRTRKGKRSTTPHMSNAARLPSPRCGEEAFALCPFARELAHAADRLRLLSRPSLRRLFIESLALHLAEDALALQLLFQHPQGLINVVVANQYLQGLFLSWTRCFAILSR